MLHTPFYDPEISYEQNFKEGPFGEFAGRTVFKNTGQPKFGFLGQKVYSPFGIAAGPLVNGKFVKAALDKGFDICTYKTVRSGQYRCNPWPNVIPVKTKRLTLENAEQGVLAGSEFLEPLTITNSFGVPSWDPDFWQKDMNDAVRQAKEGQVVVGSFQGTTKGSTQGYIKDFATAAKLVKETGAEILEVNISCPNEGSNNLLCFDLERTRQVVEAIKNEIGNTPLIIKIAYFKTPSSLEKLVNSVGKMVQGIEAINTISSKIINEQGVSAFLDGRERSGVCGAGIKWAGLEMVKLLQKQRAEQGLKFAIIGVGGVTNAEDFKEYREAGADIVMSATGAMWNPFLAQEIKEVVTSN